MPGYTAVEKILSQASGKKACAGEIVVARVDTVMAHDGTAPLAINAMREKFGVEKVAYPSKVVLIIDHIAPSSNPDTSNLHIMMREFARKHGVNFYDVGNGICHQLLPEKGYVWPGAVVVGADSHTVTHGAFGAFATGVGSTDAAIAMMTGKLWFKVPETIKMTIEGELKPPATAKDLILTIIGKMGADGATYKAVEFHGSCVKKLSVDSRMTLCNMVVEMGGKCGYIPPDEKTLAWLEGRVKREFKPIYPDPDAEYEDELVIDAAEVEPVLAAPYNVDNVKSVAELEGLEVDQVFIGSCTNGRLEDLEAAARILKGRKVKVRTIVIAASREVFLEALRRGIIEILVEAGCAVTHSTCGPCVGAHFGILGKGEVCVSTSNRNFRGRMGHPESKVYLASPITAALAAVEGKIVDPRGRI